MKRSTDMIYSINIAAPSIQFGYETVRLLFQSIKGTQ